MKSTYSLNSYLNSYKQYNRINVAGLLLNEQNQILICKRAKTKKYKPSIWHIPGGKIEINETPEDALKREFKEELNLVIKSITPLKTKFEYKCECELHCTFFYAVEAEGTIKLDFENEEFKYVNNSDLKDYLDESYPASLKAFTILQRLYSHEQ